MRRRDRSYQRRSAIPVRSQASVWTVVGLATALVLLLAIGIWLYFKGRSELVRADPETLCPTDGVPAEIVVLLLDMSDEFSERQRLMIHNELSRLLRGVRRFGLVQAYAVDRVEGHVPEPAIHLCNPGTGEELSRLYQNPNLARRRWEDFMVRLDAELQRLMELPASAKSAIFEAVQATALRTFNRPVYDGVPKRLVIVSDLLQNVPGKLSMYQGIPRFEDFKESEYFSEVRTALDGVSVTLLYLVRPYARQPWPRHIQFFEEYFRVQGATIDRVEPIYGAAGSP